MKRSSNRYLSRRTKSLGFLLIEVLVSAFILAGAISAGMYLFRVGFMYLEKIKEVNLISSKIPQALTYLQKVADLSKEKEEISLGDNVVLFWKAKKLEKIKPGVVLGEGGIVYPYELELYEVNYTLKTDKREKEYKIYVLRYKMLFNPWESL